MPRSASQPVSCFQVVLIAAAMIISAGVSAEEPKKSGADGPPTDRRVIDDEIQAIFAASCLHCHDSDTLEGGLSVETFDGLLQGGEEAGPAIVPGASAKSPLIHYLRGEKEPRMPKDEDPLSEKQIVQIELWIDSLKKPSAISRAKVWPWTPLARPEIPQPKDSRYTNPVDRFVLARLQEKGLEFAPPASPRATLRRLYFSVTGLPPSPEEVTSFVESESPTAYGEQVEKVLADPGYGEHWGRLWLDLVRYSDTRGGAIDYARPHMWRYRDYVIRAFNQDRPYDRFVREQLAGDAFGAYGTEGKLGLGFLAQWVQVERTEGPQVRRDFLTDVVGTTGSAFLGMTLACAQCHDHKFDPIPQRDYFRIEAFFAPLNTQVTDLPFTQYEQPNLEPELWKKKSEEWSALLAKRTDWQNKTKADYTRRLEERRTLDSTADLKDLVVPISSSVLRQAVKDALLFTEDEQAAYDLIGRQSARFANPNSPDYYKAKAYTASDSGLKDNVTTYVLSGGNFKLRGEEVQPGFLSAATGDSSPANLRGLSGSRRKLLANWIASPDNPLTARVMVNRIWQHHFGKGLVATPSDLGKNGSGTAYPELIDWLAAEFIDSGWSMKHIHRLILSSHVYRQSMRHPRQKDFEKVDPENRFLWVRNPVRLDGEAIRDSALAVSGDLNRERGRPPFFPVADDELLKRAPTWWEPSPKPERNRRSVYMLQTRSFQLPFMKVFDGRNMDESCPERSVTTVTPQVFALFNSQFAHEQSHAMAQRIKSAVGDAPGQQVTQAFQLAFQREPTTAEKKSCVEFLQIGESVAGTSRAVADISGNVSGSPSGNVPAAAEAQVADSPSAPVSQGTLADLCLVLLNTNEFIYLE